MNAFKLMLAGLLFGVPLLGVAATDGDLDETSTGTAVVELVIGNVLKLTDVDDLKFGRGAEFFDDAIQDDLCVFSNIQDTYKVSIVGKKREGRHVLLGPDAKALFVGYFWSDGSNTFNRINPLDELIVGGSSEHLDCDGVSNAIIRVQLEVDTEDFNPGLYTDTIFITIKDNV